VNIDHIRTFLEIAATGNFNRAADRLHVTQSTVSARVKALEAQLDRPLFVRSRNGVTLTAAGRHFQRHALAAVRAWVQACQDVALPEGFRTAFGLGATVPLWERLLLRFIPRMRAKAADVALRVEVDYSDSLTHQIADGLLDVGVMYLPRSTPGLVIERLLEERLVLVSTRRRKLTREWMDDYVFVDWGYDFRAEHSRAFPDMGAPAISVGLGQLGLRYILEHGGSGYFALRDVRPLIKAKRLFRVTDAPEFRRPTYVVYPQSPSDEVLLRTALGTLREVAEESSQSGGETL